MFEIEANLFTNPPKPQPASKEFILQTKPIRERIYQLEAKKAVIDRELNELYANCKHEIFYDASGYPYILRYCYTCNKLIEIL